MKWKEDVLNKLVKNGGELTDNYKKDLFLNNPTIHLAIFNEPYLSLIFSGKKTIESRFSKNKIVPHLHVKAGDVVILKKSGGDIEGKMKVKRVIYSGQVNHNKLLFFEENFSNQICSSVDSNFWKVRGSCNYATLIEIHKVEKITPFPIKKRDRRGWVIL